MVHTRRERDGLILGAYEGTPRTWSVDGVPEDFGMELFDPELERVAHLMADAMERIPVLGEAGIRTTVHGPVSYSADGQPLIGPAPGLRNAWLACGSGFGIGEGAGAGRLLAEWIVEGQPPMHMGIFDPRRFGDYAGRVYRVAKAVEVFALQFATHYPLEERPAGRPVKKTPVYDRLKQAGCPIRLCLRLGAGELVCAGDEPAYPRLPSHRMVRCRGAGSEGGVGTRRR